jgi:hypothetical protein
MPVAQRLGHVGHAGSAVQGDQLHPDRVAHPAQAQVHRALDGVPGQVGRHLGRHDREITELGRGQSGLVAERHRGPADGAGGRDLVDREPLPVLGREQRRHRVTAPI